MQHIYTIPPFLQSGTNSIDRHYPTTSSLPRLIQLRKVRSVAMTIALEIAVPSVLDSSSIEHLGDQGKKATIRSSDTPFEN